MFFDKGATLLMIKNKIDWSLFFFVSTTIFQIDCWFELPILWSLGKVMCHLFWVSTNISLSNDLRYKYKLRYRIELKLSGNINKYTNNNPIL